MATTARFLALRGERQDILNRSGEGARDRRSLLPGCHRYAPGQCRGRFAAVLVGGDDQVAPGEAAQRYANSLEAPSKQLVWFEHSAHTPHLEEPERQDSILRPPLRRRKHQVTENAGVERAATRPDPARTGGSRRGRAAPAVRRAR